MKPHTTFVRGRRRAVACAMIVAALSASGCSRRRPAAPPTPPPTPVADGTVTPGDGTSVWYLSQAGGLNVLVWTDGGRGGYGSAAEPGVVRGGLYTSTGPFDIECRTTDGRSGRAN